MSIFILLIGGHYVYKAIKVKNVFDEMHYAETQSVSGLHTATSFSNLIKAGVLKNLPRNMRNEFPDLKKERYRNEALNKNEDISFF